MESLYQAQKKLARTLKESSEEIQKTTGLMDEIKENLSNSYSIITALKEESLQTYKKLLSLQLAILPANLEAESNIDQLIEWVNQLTEIAEKLQQTNETLKKHHRENEDKINNLNLQVPAFEKENKKTQALIDGFTKKFELQSKLNPILFENKTEVPLLMGLEYATKMYSRYLSNLAQRRNEITITLEKTETGYLQYVEPAKASNISPKIASYQLIVQTNEIEQSETVEQMELEKQLKVLIKDLKNIITDYEKENLELSTQNNDVLRRIETARSNFINLQAKEAACTLELEYLKEMLDQRKNNLINMAGKYTSKFKMWLNIIDEVFVVKNELESMKEVFLNLLARISFRDHEIQEKLKDLNQIKTCEETINLKLYLESSQEQLNKMAKHGCAISTKIQQALEELSRRMDFFEEPNEPVKENESYGNT